MTESILALNELIAELRGELSHPERDADLTGLLRAALHHLQQQNKAIAAARAGALRDAEDRLQGLSYDPWGALLEEADRIEREVQ